MKAERTKPVPMFVPVVVTLETQAEVDVIFALLNHSTIADAVGVTGLWKVLQPFEAGYYKHHLALEALLAGRAKT